MIIRIHDLRAQTVLGVYDWEKTAPREVVLNLELELADNRAGETDELRQRSGPSWEYYDLPWLIVKRIGCQPYLGQSSRQIVSLD